MNIMQEIWDKKAVQKLANLHQNTQGGHRPGES